jgi:hypothetical protein
MLDTYPKQALTHDMNSSQSHERHVEQHVPILSENVHLRTVKTFLIFHHLGGRIVRPVASVHTSTT